MLVRMWIKGNTYALLMGKQIGAATMENSMEGLQNIKNGTALWPSDSTSGYISKETQNTNLKEYMHPYVHCSIMYSSQAMESTQVPTNRQVGKEDVTHNTMGGY